MYVSYIHASGSMTIDVCVMDVCIIHTCIRINDHRCMYHTYLHKDQGSQMYSSYIYASGSRVIDVCIIHASIRIIVVCIIHTCIKIKDHRCMHHTHMHQDQGSYVWIHASWTHLRGSHGLSARRARRTKSRRPEGPHTRSWGPEGP